jgi:hypothetical protein
MASLALPRYTDIYEDDAWGDLQVFRINHATPSLPKSVKGRWVLLAA